MKRPSFNQFDFKPILHDVISQLNFKNPTEIQKKIFTPVLEGRSVIGQSYTGSGKTHAYLLPLFNKLHVSKNEVQIVITAPTRELATQIYEDVQTIIRYANKKDVWKARLLIGGTDKRKMDEKLKTAPHIVVGTPGRILDHVMDNTLSIYSAASFVIDEADLMLDMGFIEEVDQLLIRANENIQLLVFSATIPKRLQHFFKKYLKNPLHIKIDDHLTPEKIEHHLINRRHRDDASIIFELTKVIQPYLALIFTNSKEQADELASNLQQQGIETGLIHGGLTPRERKRFLKEIENLRYQYIVATDLASRGIDIKGISHVINAKMPKEENFYVHRVGRTARAGMEGTAISFYDEEDIRLIQKLEQQGVIFNFSDVKDGEWKDAKPWNERTRKSRKETHGDINQEAWNRVKKPKHVKPGYKKKMKKEQENIKRQLMKDKQRQKKRKR